MRSSTKARTLTGLSNSGRNRLGCARETPVRGPEDAEGRAASVQSSQRGASAGGEGAWILTVIINTGNLTCCCCCPVF